MTTLATLKDTLRTRLPGAIDLEINQELFNAVDMLCRETNAYRAVVETTLVAGQAIYPIVPVGREILIVYSTAHPTMSVYGSVYDAGSIALPKAATAADTTNPLLTKVSLTPLPGGAMDPETWLPALYWGRFYQALIDGVQTRMMSQLAKPYTNPQMALYHSRRFHNEMRKLKAAADADSEIGAQHWVFPPFA